jgi:hypothetical protein
MEVPMDHPAHGKNADEKTEALIAAERLIDRLQDEVGEQLHPDSGIEDEQAYAEVIDELETAPEIETVRKALDEKPHWGSVEHARST